MQRQFSHTHIVRYDETNSEGYITPAAFLRYMQDIASLDWEDSGVDGDGLWVVKRTNIAFKVPLKVHTQMHLRTFAQGFTRIASRRGYEARVADDSSGEPVIAAHTLWVYIDANGRPKRIPEATVQTWLPDGPQAPQMEAPFPSVPEGEPVTTTVVVKFSHTDLMRHLNNASAVEMLDDAAWDAYGVNGMTPDTAQFDVAHYDIEYLNSPLFGDQLEVQTWLDVSPEVGEEFSRFQQIIRAGKVMIRAHSRWVRRA